MLPFLVIGLGVMLLATAGAKGRPARAAEPTPAEAQLFERVGGRLHYKIEVAERLVQSLLSRFVAPTGDENVVLVRPHPQGLIVPIEQGGAFFGLQALHAQGQDVWVPTNFHQPIAMPHAVVVAPPTRPDLVPAEGYAMLISALDSWPPLPVTVAAA